MAHKIDFKSTPLIVSVIQMSKNLKVVDGRFLRHPFKDLSAYWYHDSSDSEMILFRDSDQQLAKVLINIHGLLFVWSRSVGIRTGHLRGRHKLQETFRDSTTYKYDKHPNPLTLKLATLLIQLVGQADRLEFPLASSITYH